MPEITISEFNPEMTDELFAAIRLFFAPSRLSLRFFPSAVQSPAPHSSTHRTQTWFLINNPNTKEHNDDES